jgi:hypothetical protein
MRHTLTAVFDSRGEAQHSMNRLLAAGYSHADATLSIAAPAGQVNGIAAENLFARLFGTLRGDHPASDPDTSASVRHVLTFTAESEAEVTHATGIVGCLIPVDSEEIHAWRPQGIPGATHAACRPGTEPGALQNHAPGNSHYFGTRDSDSPNMDEDGYHREESGYALAPADDEASRGYQYRYRRWKAATAAQKADWTLHHPGELPPWGKFMDAVLHGWGRISLGSNDTEADSPPPGHQECLSENANPCPVKPRLSASDDPDCQPLR